MAVKREDLLRFYMVDVILYTHEVKQIQILMTRNGKIFLGSAEIMTTKIRIILFLQVQKKKPCSFRNTTPVHKLCMRIIS